MNTFSILTAQIGMFVIYMLAGVILIRTRVMNRENLEVISKFVIKLALPVMIFINTVNGVERKTLFHSLSIFLIAGIMYICLFLLSYISGIFFHLHGNHRQLYSAMSVFGNVGFMGIPIVTSIYPENGMLYICVFTIIDQLMLWTAGVRLTSGTDSQKNRFDFRKLINPVTVSILLAVICVLTVWIMAVLTGTLRTMFIAFLGLFHKVYACGMLAGIVLSTTKVSEFLSAMNRIYAPKKFVITFAVMLRYIPTIREDWHFIKDAMRMRDVSPSLGGFLSHPGMTVECIYVPLLMMASKAADELSIASVTRGIENPGPRTCLVQIRCGDADFAAMGIAAAFFMIELCMRGGAIG